MKAKKANELMHDLYPGENIPVVREVMVKQYHVVMPDGITIEKFEEHATHEELCRSIERWYNSFLEHNNGGI